MAVTLLVLMVLLVGSCITEKQEPSTQSATTQATGQTQTPSTTQPTVQPTVTQTTQQPAADTITLNLKKLDGPAIEFAGE